MMKRTIRPILASILCLLLVGCGKKEPVSPEPAENLPPAETSALVISAEPEEPPAPEEEPFSDQYTGTWRDIESGKSDGQCVMTITSEDGTRYAVDITWADERWQYTGTYDETWEGIDYIGTRYTQEQGADGILRETAALEEATGLVYLDEDGNLLWEDTFEHRGDGLVFQREP